MNFKNKGAKWLWDNCECIDNQYVAFIKEIDIEKLDKTYIYLCCDTTYTLYVNGKFVNFGQYLGLAQNKFYDKLDITKYLSVGKNLVSITVYYQGVSSSCYQKGTPGLIFFIQNGDKIFKNDNVYVTHKTGYKEGNLPLITCQLGPSFEYDARNACDYNNLDIKMSKDFVKATELEFSDYLCEDILCRPVKKLVLSEKTPFKVINKGKFMYTDSEKNVAQRMMDAFMCVPYVDKVKENEDIVIDEDNTSIIVDMGAETAGYFELSFDCDKEVQIDVAYGEHLCDMRVRSYVGGRNFAFTYHAKKGENLYNNYFRRIAGRYLQLNFSGLGKGKCVLHYVGLNRAVYPVKRLKSLKIEDKLHKKIYETCIKTLEECMHEHFEDCPWREQSLYGFDGRNQALAGYTVFENSDFVKACLSLQDSSLCDDGYILLCVPQGGKLKISGFSLMWIVAVCEYVDNTGKIKDMEKFFPDIEYMFGQYLSHIDKSGVVLLPESLDHWYFYDWTDGLSGKIRTKDNMDTCQKEDAVFNLLVMYAMKKYIAVCKKIKRECKDLVLSFENLKNSINNVYYNKEKGLYSTFSDKEHYAEIVQALAVVSDVANNKADLRKVLASDNDLVEASLSTVVLKYEALMQDKKYYGYVLDNIAEIWGNMLYDGATTFYETAKGQSDFDNAGSLCHGWSACPLVVYKKVFDR